MRFVFKSRDRITIQGRDLSPLHSDGHSPRLLPISRSGECVDHPVPYPHRLHNEGRQDGSKQSKPPSSA